MSNHEDQLRRAFATQQDRTPDPAAVYARVQELSRSYKWRRRGAQAAGGAVLSAGLIAGIANLPAVLPAGPATQAADTATGIPAVAPALLLPSGAPSQGSSQTALDAYFAAGYDYDDAVRLAQLWHLTGSIGQVKAEAGRRLLAGETLPFPATPNPPAGEEPADPQVEAALAAYFGAGYDWDDAVQLAKLWKKSDPYDAKVLAGKKLLAGQTLPVRPDPANVKAGLEAKRVNAFFAAGYDVDDAIELAKLWKKADAYQAKVEGGKRLLAGQTLPIQP